MRSSHFRTTLSQTRSVGVSDRRLRDPDAEEPLPFFVDDNATTLLLRGADHSRTIVAQLIERELPRPLLRTAPVRHDRHIVPLALTSEPVPRNRARKRSLGGGALVGCTAHAIPSKLGGLTVDEVIVSIAPWGAALILHRRRKAHILTQSLHPDPWEQR